MHEISLVQNLFQQLEQLAKENNCDKIRTVTMEVGPLSGVVVDSFQFGFDILSRDHPLLQEAELKIELPPVNYTCSSCGGMEICEQRPESCPQCGETLLIPEGGDDLILKQVELE